MNIRRAQPADHEAWLEMRLALWPHGTREEFLKEMELYAGARPTWVAFVAESEDGALAGFLEATLHEFASGCTTNPVGYVEGVYVKAEWRRSGVGQALMNAAEVWARELGCREMASDCHLEHGESIQFHLGSGYEEVERVVMFRRRGSGLVRGVGS